QRLLEAAGEEFARRGFENASVRAMCVKADANVSAVKYHFGSKRDLYAEVWRKTVERTVTYKQIPDFASATELHDDLPAAREALRTFVRWFIELMLFQDARMSPSLGHLLSHEMLSPTPGGIDLFLERCARPIHRELRAIISTLTGRPANDRLLGKLANHVIALCVHPHQSRDVHAKTGAAVPGSKPALRKFADEISQFALGGIETFRIGDKA
ncbi:MAG: CerR family C-terminal domain-containing protein, partial [Planctomycetota bacterium]